MTHFEIFQYPLVIKEQHLDFFGHVNNATYLEILEEARWEFVTARGFGLETIYKLGTGPVILECHLKFIKELRVRQVITIETQLLTYDKKIGSLRQTILNEQGEVCCEATMIFGLFCLKERKLILPSDAWLHAVGAI